MASILGQGSTFSLRLPPALDLPEVVETEGGGRPFETSSGQPPAPSGQGQCILLVEDNEPAIIQMTDILHDQGYQVLVARNGREALTQIEKTLPDATS